MKILLKKIIRALLCLWSIILFLPSVKALSTGEQYSEFSTKKIPLGSIHTTSGYFSIYGYNGTGSSCSSATAPISCFYNGTNSLVTYGHPNDTTRSQYAIKYQLNSSLVQGNTYEITTKILISDPNAYNYSYYFDVSGMENLKVNSATTTATGRLFTTVFNVTANKTVDYIYIDFINRNPLSLSLLDDIIAGIYYPKVSFISGPATDISGLENNTQIIIDQNQSIIDQNNQTNESLDKIDGTLKDSSVDSSDSTINNLKGKIPTNSVISDLLLLPVKFLQNFVNALGSSCTKFSLGNLYGTDLFMPCINLETYLGSGIWTTIDLFISGLFVYSLRKKFIQIYENLTNLTNGGNEVD